MINVFISHSSQDQALAECIVDLLRSALNLPANTIRCTSVDGYRLPIGADTDEQLREEILSARAFVGILSSMSLASAYVLFELGARWGAGKSLAPLLAPGMTTRALRGPIAGLNALSCESAAQLHQFVHELGNVLGIQPEAPHVYQAKIDSVVSSGTRVAIEAQLAPRRLDSNHSQLMVAELRQFRGQKLKVLLPAEAEPRQYGESIIRTLQDAGWTPVRHDLNLITRPIYGLHVYGPHPESSSAIQALILKLVEAGNPVYSAGSNDVEFHLSIGLKPQPGLSITTPNQDPNLWHLPLGSNWTL
jgi:hypothetical protein